MTAVQSGPSVMRRHDPELADRVLAEIIHPEHGGHPLTEVGPCRLTESKSC
jgi:hypothetical protein